MNRKILKANYLYIDGVYYQDYAVVFDTQIIEVAGIEAIKANYPDCFVEDLGEGSLLFPGFVNTHVHLEFSSNQTTLQYGSFVGWLESVLVAREEIINGSTSKVIEGAIETMLSSGVCAFGAISSYALELEALSSLSLIHISEPTRPY